MLWNAILAWFIAQSIKLILHLIAYKELSLRILRESGGMPSSHSAIICAISVSIGQAEGFHSPLFALACVMAMIVMYDAMGVRRAAGEQGKVLNKLLGMMNISDQTQTALKEVVGHKPLEVFAGAVLGIFTSVTLNILI
ncbi:MAG: divergent PAP2 family protein [Clostridia bacterium]|nr:divergent PAP2 family protein [Clostridia bacterium]